ncbi:MAG: hypothetical protein ACT4PL_09840 [Phycisphaerales bacterium]
MNRSARPENIVMTLTVLLTTSIVGAACYKATIVSCCDKVAFPKTCYGICPNETGECCDLVYGSTGNPNISWALPIPNNSSYKKEAIAEPTAYCVLRKRACVNGICDRDTQYSPDPFAQPCYPSHEDPNALNCPPAEGGGGGSDD